MMQVQVVGWTLIGDEETAPPPPPSSARRASCWRRHLDQRRH